MEARTADGATPLHAAARDGNAGVVTALAAAGADPNIRTENGYLLHWASELGGVEVVKALLDAGADPQARDEDDSSPLHLAAKSNDDPAVIEALLDAGATPNALDRNGKIPWDLARDREALKGSDVYWRLNDLYYQYQSETANASRTPNSVGGDITTPTLLTQVLPEYSEEAREAEYQGTVILETIVRRDGTVDVVRVARSLPFGLDEKAIEAVTQWRFRPGMRNGEPVDVKLKIEVNFNRR